MKTNEEKKEVGRFLCAGVIATAVDFGIYYLGMNFFAPAIAKSISFVCGGVAAFFLNKYWTFKQDKQSPQEVVRFVVANTGAFVVNVLTNELMLRITGKMIFTSLSFATVVTAVLTYFVFKHWVFTSQAVVPPVIKP